MDISSARFEKTQCACEGLMDLEGELFSERGRSNCFCILFATVQGNTKSKREIIPTKKGLSTFGVIRNFFLDVNMSSERLRMFRYCPYCFCPFFPVYRDGSSAAINPD